MENTEALQMMQRCAEDIRALRRQIDTLRPKAEAYDMIAKILQLLPSGHCMGSGEDVLWLLDRKIAKLKADRTKKRSGPAVDDADDPVGE